MNAFGLVEVHEAYFEGHGAWIFDSLLVEWIRDVDSIGIGTIVAGKLARRVGLVRLRRLEQQCSPWKRWRTFSDEFMRDELVLLE